MLSTPFQFVSSCSPQKCRGVSSSSTVIQLLVILSRFIYSVFVLTVLISSAFHGVFHLPLLPCHLKSSCQATSCQQSYFQKPSRPHYVLNLFKPSSAQGGLTMSVVAIQMAVARLGIRIGCTPKTCIFGFTSPV